MILHLLVLLLFVRIFHASEQGSSSTDDFPEFTPSHATALSNTFELVGEHMKCEGVRLSRELVKEIRECFDNCTRDMKCHFFMFWRETNWCETYETCSIRPTDEEGRILLLQKLSECERELGRTGRGNYITQISNAFAEQAVQINKNIWCRCVSHLLMICGIFVEPGTREEKIVRAKLNTQDLVNMKPFYVYPSLWGDPGRIPITFDPDSGLGDSRVSAEIEILTFRSCIPLSVCVQGSNGPTCPVSKLSIRGGDPVYLLASDAAKVRQALKPKSVLCISLGGLRALASTEASFKEGGFTDPFKRRRQERLTIANDYVMYFAFTDHQLAKGICGQKPAIMDDFPRESYMEPEVDREKQLQNLLSSLGLADKRYPVQDRGSVSASSFRHRNPTFTIPNPSTIADSKPDTSPQIEAQHFRQFRKAQVFASNNPTTSPTSPIPLPAIGEEMMTISAAFQQEGLIGKVVKQHPHTNQVTLRLETGDDLVTSPKNLITKAEAISLIDRVIREEDTEGTEGEDLSYPPVGSLMMIRSLKGRTELNGKQVKVIGIQQERKRVAVRIQTGNDAGEVINVKPRNLLSFQELPTMLVARKEKAEKLLHELRSRKVAKSTSHTPYMLHISILLFIFTFVLFLHQFFCYKHDEDIYIEFSSEYSGVS